MHVIVTNLDGVAVPLSSTQGEGFAAVLKTGEPYTLDSKDVTVANVGDNPSASEEFVDGMRDLLKKFSQMIAFWREHNEKAGEEEPHAVHVRIQNSGVNDLRVLLGSNLVEAYVSTGTSYEAKAPEYIEIRELGV